ncbi:hypothetical protein MOQ72_33065 [Saccharopolyspora sp. K220]|uniref:trypsin-like serine peptidase n=1 Tax=Saccharopolyspora soli TaxID=2926618 RepID=UPI001F57882D|nr:hypothetical protein [Saccharopolyspora soli]MCI2422274.1 hypothetical protein [Saccharopolyspora soli]
MPTTRQRFRAVVSGLGVATIVGLAPAAASAADSVDGDVVVHQVAASAQEQQAIRDYWTPERIAAMPTGPVPEQPQPPVDGPDGAGWSGGGAIDRTVGRLFFTERGEDASCTATIVRSANRSVAVTAGHCVHGFDLLGQDPQWTTNLYFVPGFRDGAMPFGGFVPRLAIADRSWVDDDQQIVYDQAFLVLNPAPDGRAAADVVGASQDIAFDLPGDREVAEFGYPRAANQPGHQGRPEFTGQRLAWCWGIARENPGTPSWPVPKGQFGVACDMGGGSSGGPRIAGFDGDTGAVAGVNTRSWYLDDAGKGCELDSDLSQCTRNLGGPQFTPAITLPLYERAQHA